MEDIFELFWDFFDTELFEVGDKTKNGVNKLLKKMVQDRGKIVNFYKSLKYLIGIEGNALQRGVLQYNFKDLDSDILGKAYETFLARRKQRGVYYTPTYISKFLFKNTVGLFLDQNIEKIEEFLQVSDYFSAKRVLEDIFSFRIVDPACGSGSFLIMVYNTIADKYSLKI